MLQFIIMLMAVSIGLAYLRRLAFRARLDAFENI